MPKLKIISYNICALPYYVNLYGNPHERIHKIIKFIKQQRAHIICLQEAFDINIRKILIKNLDKHYYSYYMNSTSKYKLNNGLMIFTIYPIIYNKYILYNNACGEDRFSEKGTLYCTIKVPTKKSFKKVTILNTHLNADAIFSFKFLCKKVRIKQVNQLRNNIKNIKNDIILCGDLNIDIIDDIKIYNNITKYKKHIIKSDRYITFPSEKKQFDYIFYMSNNLIHSNYNYKVHKNRYSDHYPIELVFNL
jgi:endonuclease/exonuclease/phosphatase family metal-dependent hydrolase